MHYVQCPFSLLFFVLGVPKIDRNALFKAGPGVDKSKPDDVARTKFHSDFLERSTLTSEVPASTMSDDGRNARADKETLMKDQIQVIKKILFCYIQCF